MLVKIEARILIFPGTDFHFPSTSVPPGTFLGSEHHYNNKHLYFPQMSPLQQATLNFYHFVTSDQDIKGNLL